MEANNTLGVAFISFIYIIPIGTLILDINVVIRSIGIPDGIIGSDLCRRH
jgi:hypothetical protein